MESILYARLPDDIVVIRVIGKGNHQNSAALRKLLDLTSTDRHCPQYIFDLEKCVSMDSTFMGVMATIALRQKRSRPVQAVVVNMNPHVEEQLDLLGLKYVLEMRGGSPAPIEDAKFSSVAAPQVGKLERAIMIIEAHERLIDVDSQNEVRFKGVIQALRESLGDALQQDSRDDK